ncbi:unnamed protein product [Linum trigynum]|uniref:Uncharacterized protein n=1 Tax=Linum trigynum TaxID=586398 RepID=A0AAV2DBZ9_9ROSI
MALEVESSNAKATVKFLEGEGMILPTPDTSRIEGGALINFFGAGKLYSSMVGHIRRESEAGGAVQTMVFEAEDVNRFDEEQGTCSAGQLESEGIKLKIFNLEFSVRNVKKNEAKMGELVGDFDIP